MAPYEQRWVDRGRDRIGLQWYGEPERPAMPLAARLTAGSASLRPLAAAPLVVIWPAMGVPARFYRPFATELRSGGLAVAVADLRGTGASTPRASRTARYGYAELADDVGAVLAELAGMRAGRPVLLLGHSLGGQACLLHLASSGGGAAAQVDGLALVAVGLPYWRVYADRRRHWVLPFTQAIHATTTLLGVWPGWGFGGRQARGVIRDWAYTARTGRFPARDGVDLDAAVAAVRTPVLTVSVERDQYTPAPTVDHLVGKLVAAPVQREHVDGGADHFSWARSPGPIAGQVVRFATGLPG